MEDEKILVSSGDNEDEDVLLPGFRFHPTDEELVGFYLKRKVEKKLFSIELIKQVDIYKYDPWDLPITKLPVDVAEVSKLSTVTEKEWYFFCRRGRKYRNSIRPNRVTRSGFWKATGIDKPIYSNKGFRDCIGLKKSLVYYRGSAGKGTKTDWMMHEFRLPASQNPTLSNTNKKDNLPEAEVWTLCRIFQRDVSYKKYASEWQNNKKNPSKQNLIAASSSRTSSVESDDIINVKGFGVLDDKEIQRKLVNDHFLGKNQFFAPGTTQVPSCFSFSNPNGNEIVGQPNCDELRPMVDYSFFGTSMQYSDW